MNPEPTNTSTPAEPTDTEQTAPGYLVTDPPASADADESAEGASEVEPEDAFSWQASEYIHHDKTGIWYLVVVVVALILVGGLALFKQWFSIPVVIAMAAAIMVFGARPPRVLNYSLDEHGITIEAKFYPYAQFRSFAVIQDVAWHSIDLEPTQRFMPRLTVLFDNDDFAVIVNLLSSYLPEVDRQPDWIERLSRYLKF